MLDGKIRPLQNTFAIKSISKNAEMPNINLAIAGDDEMSNVPILIFRDQHQPVQPAVVPNLIDLPYEKTAVKGAGDTLSIDNFVTDDFNLGAEYDFLT